MGVHDRELYDDEWIMANHNGNCSRAFHKRYMQETGHVVKYETFRAHIRRKLKLYSTTFYYTDDELSFVRQNYNKMGAATCAEKLGCGLTKVYSMRRRMGLKLTREEFGRFVNVYQDIYPVGTIRQQGLKNLVIKTEDGWKQLGRYVWEQHNGELPKGYVVLFLNGDKADARIENLMAVPCGIVGALNVSGWRFDDPDMTKASVLILELQRALTKFGGVESNG